LLARAFVDQDVHAVVLFDLESRREGFQAARRRSAFARYEEAIARLQYHDLATLVVPTNRVPVIPGVGIGRVLPRHALMLPHGASFGERASMP